jgi:hypothetical protein
MKSRAFNHGVIPRVVLIVSFAAVMVFLPFQPAFAGGGGNDYYVATTGVDTDFCLINPCRTIAYAINQAASGDRIHIAAGTYTENLTPGKNLIFYGAGMDSTILDGGGVDSVIYDSSSDLSIMDMTIRNGHSSDGSGGGIAHYGGTLVLTRVKVTGNVAHNGGGILSSGQLTMTDCEVSANVAETGSLVGYGGGIFLQGSCISATLVNVTISGNTATGYSGGLHNQRQGTVSFTNVTISGNTAATNGAMSTTNSSTLNLLNCTIADNHYSAGGSNGGIGNYATTHFTNTIIAGNQGTNCFNGSGGTLNTLGGNLDSGNTCSFNHPSDYRNIDPLLGPLADNGGLTETRALLTGSVAIDGGTNTGCPSTDQRGVTRPLDGNLNGVAVCDIGAYERCPNKPAHIDGTSSYYDLIGQAYVGISPTVIIKTQMYEFSEDLSFGLDRTVTLKGGYGCDFETNAGSYSTINGSLTISAGAVIIENMKIK